MKINKNILFFSLAAAATFISADVAAETTTLGGMAAEAEKNIEAIKRLALSVFYMIGLFLFGMGLFLLYKDQKTPNQGHAKNGFISIAVGVCMLLIPQLVNIVGTSIGGDGAVAESKIKTATGF